MVNDVLLGARALILRDLSTRQLDLPGAVDVLDTAVAERRWWVEQWPEGADYVAGQLAQDVQDRLLDSGLGRWPLCKSCDETAVHELHIHPELGPDPQWTCEKTGITVAALGSL